MMSGLLDNPDISLGAMSIYQTVNGIAFMLPWGVASASGTRVGNALGAGDAISARRASTVGAASAVTLSLAAGLLLITARHSIVSVFTSDQLLRETAAPLLCALAIYVVADSFQAANGSLHNGSLHNGSLHSGSLHSGSLHNGSLFNGSLFNGSLHNGSLFNGSLLNGSLQAAAAPC